MARARSETAHMKRRGETACSVIVEIPALGPMNRRGFPFDMTRQLPSRRNKLKRRFHQSFG